MRALLLALCGCAGEHRVSPWGDRGAPPVGAFVEKPDLDARLASIDSELRDLRLVTELAGRDSKGTDYVVRGYAGRDGLGRPLSAVRVATQFAVIYAAGPRDDLESGGFDRLLAALASGPGETLRLPADFDGDGRPELILLDDRDRPLLVSLAPRGATPLKVSPLLPLARAETLPEGRRGLVLRQSIATFDTRKLALDRLVVLRGGAFVEDAPEVVAWHAARAARVSAELEAARVAAPSAEPAPSGAPGASGADGAPRQAGSAAQTGAPAPSVDALERRLLRAFHLARSGGRWAELKQQLLELAVPPDQTPAWRDAIGALERALTI